MSTSTIIFWGNSTSTKNCVNQHSAIQNVELLEWVLGDGINSDRENN